MSDNNIKPVRVLHLVSSEGVTGAAQQALFMPMLTRMPKARVKKLVIALSPNVVPGAVLRQNGVPVYDVALSKQRFSIGAFGQLLKAVRAFQPDVIQAWGHTAQIVSDWVAGRCDWDVKLVFTCANTAPLPRNSGFIDRQKLKYAAKLAKNADSIVYTSEAGASAHRRVGFPEEGYSVVPLGVDPTRYKPDLAARRKLREQLGLAPEAFVIGMMAPFQPEYDHATFIKAVGELIKTTPNISVLLAGHGVQKGNAPLMALVGGGTMGTRTQLLGEWSDVAAFYNACDLACSSALTDSARMSLAIAMLCGIPCVATGMGAQGEVIGQFGVAVEPGNPTALIRGITRVLQLPQDKRVFMAQGARKHALANFVSIRSLQKYLQLYYDLVGRKLEAAASVPAPKIDATIPAPKPEDNEPPKAAVKAKTNREMGRSPNAAGAGAQERPGGMYDLSDPDSLESRDSPSTHAPALKPNEADVLQLFETAIAQQPAAASPSVERARGVADESEDLLAPEMLQSGGAAQTSAPAAAPIAASTETPLELVETPAKTKAEAPAPSVTPAPAQAKMPAPKPEPAPSMPAAVKAAEELSLVDTTITVSMKISLDATSTLEIPPELIFTTVTAPKPATQPQASAPAPKPAPSLDVAAPAPVAAKKVEQPAVTADSSTVPALAVDALLAGAAAASSTPSADESLQLELLGEPPTDLKLAAG